MALSKRWAGTIWGTNVGNLYFTLDGPDSALSGLLRLHDREAGVAVYEVKGKFEAPNLTISGVPLNAPEGVELGGLVATGVMNAKGEFHGDWETSIGTAGTFVLYPHLGGEQPSELKQAAQFHVARHNFGAIEIDRKRIEEVSENIAQEFPNVIVTVVAGTEQSYFLEEFRNRQFPAIRAEILKIFAQKPDGSGANQVVSIEFGPEVNVVMVQGASEAWVLGQREKLKRDLKRYERAYVTSFKKWGIGINQLMLLAGIVYMPSLNSFLERLAWMAFILFLIFLVGFAHSKLVPFAAIYLENKRESILSKAWPGIVSWTSAVLAAVMATLAATYIEHNLTLDGSKAASIGETGRELKQDQ